MNDEPRAESNGMKAFESLRRVLGEIGWDSEPDERNASFYVDLGSLHSPVLDAMAAIAVNTERFIFYVNFGPAAPTGRRDEVARFITRVNWALSIGNFEMDYEDGHVRFKSSVDFSSVELSEMLIRNAILSAMHAVEAYADALIEVIAGRKNAEHAIKDAKAKAEA